MNAHLETPLVSVVVPTYRRPELLMRCLRALAAQTLPAPAYEIIVVDDGRCDTTRTVVLALAQEPALPAFRYLRPTGTQGPAAARNAGWREARGEIVAFTDDDTVPRSDWLALGATALIAHPNWAGLAGRVVVPLGPEPPTDHERMTQGLERAEFVTANAFVRRAALLRVRGFDERFTRAWREDSDLQFRLQAQAGDVGRCDDAIVLHPVRRERWGVSLRQQKNAFFEALLYAKHPQRYRGDGGLPIPWDYYAIVALALAAAALAGAGHIPAAGVSLLVALLLVARFAAQRLRHTSRRAGHVLEMLVTSALIPFLSVHWRLRGALRFRVWFL
jgi:glycosyltransferase involved in cell wall biosynthesis